VTSNQVDIGSQKDGTSDAHVEHQPVRLWLSVSSTDVTINGDPGNASNTNLTNATGNSLRGEVVEGTAQAPLLVALERYITHKALGNSISQQKGHIGIM
jgi:hypothetical protein